MTDLQALKEMISTEEKVEREKVKRRKEKEGVEVVSRFSCMGNLNFQREKKSAEVTFFFFFFYYKRKLIFLSVHYK